MSELKHFSTGDHVVVRIGSALEWSCVVVSGPDSFESVHAKGKISSPNGKHDKLWIRKQDVENLKNQKFSFVCGKVSLFV